MTERYEFFDASDVRTACVTPDYLKTWLLLSFLTTLKTVGIIDNMRAVKITEHKSVEADGSIIQFVVWKVPTPVPPTSHGFKYRMVYVQNGERVVGFDNERGKGDYMHLDGHEYSYRFTTIDQLIEDFLSEIEKRRQS